MRVVTGRNPVVEALKAKRVQRLFVSDAVEHDKALRALLDHAKAVRVPPETVPAATIERYARGTVHQGVVALCEERDYFTLDEVLAIARERQEDPFLILLDGVEDPHNLGAILRVADGAGAHGVVIPGRGATGLTPTVFKSSAGAAEHVPVAQVGSIMDAVLALKRAEVWVGMAEADAGKAYYEENMTGPLALVMGSEGYGVSKPIVKHCDFAVKIPLKGAVTSLNVSVATAILCYERVRQLAQGRPRGRKGA
ncbi:MAG TPA: 23S rRNA (guanosine(2251)-2'-O)-methyltransferase RlmB [Candidatus Thermoplasmatota archaeon]|nr:23S rRNA (guanosine(2251)-2'-O)-methyltransferase RlmB [Candidatus Thermoplasmatota archaeon]